MSQCRSFVQAGAVVLMISLLGTLAGCKKKSDFSAPDIKVITTDNIHFVRAVDDNHIWIANNEGKIFHSADGGATWQEQQSGVDMLLTGGDFVDPHTGWIPGLYGTIVHTSDGGLTWQQQRTNTDYHLFSVSFVDARNGWAVGEWNTILHTNDGGTTWHRLTEVQDRILSNISMADAMHGWAIGEAGLILRTSDGGQNWEQQMPADFERATFEEEFENPRPALFGVQAIDSKTAFICGLDATILRTMDGGATWDAMQTESDYPLYTVKVMYGKGWAVGDKGAYLQSFDNGETWQLKEDVITSRQWFRDVSFSSPEKGWVVGQAGVVVGTTDGGASWQFYSGLSYEMDFFEMPRALEFRDLPTWGPFVRE